MGDQSKRRLVREYYEDIDSNQTAHDGRPRKRLVREYYEDVDNGASQDSDDYYDEDDADGYDDARGSYDDADDYDDADHDAAPAPQPMTAKERKAAEKAARRQARQDRRQGKKKGGCIKIVLIVAAVLVVLVLLFSCAGSSGSSGSGDSTSQAEGSQDGSTQTDDVTTQLVDLWKKAYYASNEENYEPYSYITNNPADPDEANRTVTLESDLPSAFDLRDYGLVTPVKGQGGLGTCWAFAETAAAETSLLTAMDTTYDESGLDLSELQLAWFTYEPVPYMTEDENGEWVEHPHGGEGTFFTNEESDADIRLRLGGFGYYAGQLFASGTGPLTEDKAPYRNAEGDYQGYVWMPGDTTSRKMSLTDDLVTALEDKGAYVSIRNYALTVDTIDLDTVTVTDSKAATWALDNDLWGTSDYVILDGNYLPEYRVLDSDGKYVRTDENAIAATKEELYRGHGVAVSILADRARSDDDANYSYYDPDMGTLYVNETEDTNHVICIVGYDDDYPKENFGAGHSSMQPPADGAWICKNSWGAETEEFPNDGTYGVKDENGLATGYLYLSYYDQSIDDPVSFAFDLDTTSNDDSTIYQYNYLLSKYMPTTKSSETKSSMANVFTASEDGYLYAFGCETTHPNTTVTYEIYLLGDDAANPADGELAARLVDTNEFGGYHRIEIVEDERIPVSKGQKFSVVVTQYCEDNHLYYQGVTRYVNWDKESAEDYENYVAELNEQYYQEAYSASYDRYIAEGLSEEEADDKAIDDGIDYILSEEVTELINELAKNYGTDPNHTLIARAEVNEGESYLYYADSNEEGAGGTWADWAPIAKELGTSFSVPAVFDNFPIKAFAIAAE